VTDMPAARPLDFPKWVENIVSCEAAGKTSTSRYAHRFLVLEEIFVSSSRVAEMLMYVDYLVSAYAGGCESSKPASCSNGELSSIHGD
jgi:hypothetical protein